MAGDFVGAYTNWIQVTTATSGRSVAHDAQHGTPRQHARLGQSPAASALGARVTTVVCMPHFVQEAPDMQTTIDKKPFSRELNEMMASRGGWEF